MIYKPDFFGEGREGAHKFRLPLKEIEQIETPSVQK